MVQLSRIEKGLINQVTILYSGNCSKKRGFLNITLGYYVDNHSLNYYISIALYCRLVDHQH